jgi:peptide-methionine (R)-S-oxide reductase
MGTDDRDEATPGSGAPGQSPETVTVVQFSDSGECLGPAAVAKVVRPDSEWLELLTTEQFLITRRRSTESAFTGHYAYSEDQGIYRCVCCGNALFSSETKFDSGTGWPSFWAPLAAENVQAYGIEIACRECDAHLGHVFGDGPQPTGLRFCINSAALVLVAKT